MAKRVLRGQRRVVTGVGVVCAAVVVVGFLVPASAEALPGQVSCGATITADTKLASDLVNCPNNGIVIGADDIVLDLNGHTVGGDGAPVASCPEGAFCDVGIDNTAGHTGVTIRNGAVRSFDVAVFVLGASDNRINRLSSANSASVGLVIGESSDTRIDHNSSAKDGVIGILTFDSHDMGIDHNSIRGTTGYAVPILRSSHIRVEQNRLSDNQHGFLLDCCDGNIFRGNRSDSGGAIEVANAQNNRVEENVLNGDSIILGNAKNTRVSDNRITGTGSVPSEAGGFGILLDGGDHNLVQRNTLTGGRGPAIWLTQLEAPSPPDHNVISHNFANEQFVDGIRIDPTATATLVERNTANSNGDDGIDAAAPGTTVTANTANDNTDLGIEAVPGVIDGGGNKASGNGNPAQCLNVHCR
jgi:parallel beta-helix repeat protein